MRVSDADDVMGSCGLFFLAPSPLCRNLNLISSYTIGIRYFLAGSFKRFYKKQRGIDIATCGDHTFLLPKNATSGHFSLLFIKEISSLTDVTSNPFMENVLASQSFIH
eukprot:TRINITY_DN4576_c0_g2_i2.p2 TRINITY_DN4576_c0_g2~~TRINITY_DN4576_c0_g2_i2.p2  ORF type:complete len:108 (-),score=8.55 TRINITY_DN4576_c0_g2_i2:25-348(-)